MIFYFRVSKSEFSDKTWLFAIWTKTSSTFQIRVKASFFSRKHVTRTWEITIRDPIQKQQHKKAQTISKTHPLGWFQLSQPRKTGFGEVFILKFWQKYNYYTEKDTLHSFSLGQLIAWKRRCWRTHIVMLSWPEEDASKPTNSFQILKYFWSVSDIFLAKK